MNRQERIYGILAAALGAIPWNASAKRAPQAGLV